MILQTKHQQTQPCRVVAFYSRDTRHFSYVLSDVHSGTCAIIDPSANYTACSGLLVFRDANTIVQYIHDHSLTVQWLLETDIHTSHFSAAAYIRKKTGGKLAISAAVAEIPKRLKSSHGEIALEPAGFDCMLQQGQTISLGELQIKPMAIPGRSPAAMAFLVSDCLFSGSSLLMPDKGAACACSPLADRNKMQQSLLYMLKLPATLRVFVGRDSDNATRSLEYETTIGQLRQTRLNQAIPRGSCLNRSQYASEFCALFWPALQYNLRAQFTGSRYCNLTFPLSVEK
ncbi:hypothetical protein SAMN02745866_02510 [Alteromonadaceae bacterium Bs31]|nr:hypothetical protein SAMN02745866_02510 [Alteromonadaceae bacterium Bs31]